MQRRVQNKSLQLTFAADTQPARPQNAHRPQMQLNSLFGASAR